MLIDPLKLPNSKSTAFVKILCTIAAATERGEKINGRRIGDATGLHNVTVSQTLWLLETDALIRRSKPKADRRCWQYTLTEEGRKMVRSWQSSSNSTHHSAPVPA